MNRNKETSNNVKTQDTSKKAVSITSQESSAPDTGAAIVSQLGTTDAVQRAALSRLPPRQRQSAIHNLGQLIGNRALQRVLNPQQDVGATVENTENTAQPSTTQSQEPLTVQHNPPTAPRLSVVQPRIQRTLRTDAGSDWSAALLMIKSTSDEIFANQINAVAAFCSAAAGAQPPFEDAVMQSVLEAVLGAAFGGIGTVLKAAATRALTVTTVRLELAALNTALDAGDVTTAMTATTDRIVDTVIGAGKSNVTASVQAAVTASRGAGASTLEAFRSAQSAALISLRGNQERSIYGELGSLRSTPDPSDEWIAANALYAGLMSAKDAAFNVQYSKLTDLWFTRQVTSIGGGVRPGILRIDLRGRYPDAGDSFSISGANLSGEGSADAIRAQLATRTLRDIEIPKWITMNGDMGHGILDCTWHMGVNGGVTVAGPAISAARPLADRLVDGPQIVQAYGEDSRWGDAWLAAYQLNLHDLDNSDARNTSENQSAAVRRIWNTIKNLTPGTISNSSWS